MKDTTQSVTPLKTEVKTIKHLFSPDERLALGIDLARQHGVMAGIEAEFDQIKSAYKARTAETEAKVGSLSTALVNGFDMRNESCVVVFRPKDRKKDFYLEDAWKATESQLGKPLEMGLVPVLTKDMTRDDFQAELIQTESKFDHREEIPLFPATETESGNLVVGRFGGKWFCALRVNIGKMVLAERLDSEQRAFKARIDAVRFGVKGFMVWSEDNMKDLAKGFQKGADAILEAQKERVE